MAAFDHTSETKKAGSLHGASLAGGGASGRRSRHIGGITVADSRRGRSYAWVVDVIILLLILGLAAGTVVGYRYLKGRFAPVWENRTVYYCILVEDLEPSMVSYDEEGKVTLCGRTVWSSDREKADMLGKVTSVDPVLVTAEGEADRVDLYIYVCADAKFRVGSGYRMEDTRLLAGDEGVYRFGGLVAKGRIIALGEVRSSEETEVVPGA